MAVLRIDDLLGRIGYCATRWDLRLSDKSKANLAQSQDQLVAIRKVLARPIAGLDARDKARLHEGCGLVIRIFSEEHGTAMKAADTEV
jgi:hypothetical protein